jgi:hypothetical protein
MNQLATVITLPSHFYLRRATVLLSKDSENVLRHFITVAVVMLFLNYLFLCGTMRTVNAMFAMSIISIERCDVRPLPDSWCHRERDS